MFLYALFYVAHFCVVIIVTLCLCVWLKEKYCFFGIFRRNINIISKKENFSENTEIKHKSWFFWIPNNLGKLLYEFVADTKGNYGRYTMLIKDDDNCDICFCDVKPPLSDYVPVKVTDFLNYNYKQLYPVFTANIHYANGLYSGTAELYFYSKEGYCRIARNYRNAIRKNRARILVGNKDSFVTMKLENELTYKAKFSFKFNVQEDGAGTMSSLSVTYLDIKKIDNPVGDFIDFNGICKIEDELANALYTMIKKIFHNDNHHSEKIDTIVTVQQKEGDAVAFDANKIFSSMAA